MQTNEKNQDGRGSLKKQVSQSWFFGFKYPPLIVGVFFVIASPLLIFLESEKLVIKGSFSQQELGVIFLVIGGGILVTWFLLVKLALSKYSSSNLS